MFDLITESLERRRHHRLLHLRRQPVPSNGRFRRATNSQRLSKRRAKSVESQP
jgi:hypothetical protein